MGRVSVIDLGTNTVRLLVAEDSAPGLHPIYQDQKITRLGENLHNTGTLIPSAIERTVEVIRRFHQASREFRPDRYLIAGTSAVRQAGNREELSDRILQSVGVPLTVISGEEEARLSLLGTLLGIERTRDNVVLLDIGGGSTEYVLSEGDRFGSAVSTSLGVVRLTETHLTRHPVPEQEYTRLAEEVGRTLKSELGPFALGADFELVGTAGTITTIAAVDLNMDVYDPGRVNNYRMRRANVQSILDRLKPMTLSERLAIKAIEKGREDLLIAGLAILIATFDFFKKDTIVVSDYGLREGLAMDLILRNGADR
jgi:exopolyphosphatase/guanosine-5'-triphosphate,3'-diphosphate pyrophosphatase